MSATGRSNVREQHDEDFYGTPAWCTRAILRILGEPHPVLDPCAGERAILDVCDDVWDRQHTGFDLVDRGRPSISVRDALSPEPWGHSHGIVVTNPPYKLALEFVQRAIVEVPTVAMLLRLPFLESVERQAFHQKHPADIYILSKRPSFCAVVACASGERKKGCGWRVSLAVDAPRPKACVLCAGPTKVTTSDATAYAWFVWGTDRGGRWEIIPHTAMLPGSGGRDGA